MEPITEKDNRDELNWLSDKISTQVRWFAVGVIAFGWGLYTASEPAVRYWSPALIFSGLLATTTLFADFLQYMAGFRAAMRLRAEIRRRGLEVRGYDPTDFWYRARGWLFTAKQWIAVATFVTLIVAVAPALAR